MASRTRRLGAVLKPRRESGRRKIEVAEPRGTIAVVLNAYMLAGGRHS